MPEILSLNKEQQKQVRGLNAEHGFGYFETMNVTVQVKKTPWLGMH